MPKLKKPDNKITLKTKKPQFVVRSLLAKVRGIDRSIEVVFKLTNSDATKPATAMYKDGNRLGKLKTKKYSELRVVDFNSRLKELDNIVKGIKAKKDTFLSEEELDEILK